MNIAQEVLTPAVPPPCSIPDSQNKNSSKDSTNNHSNPAPEPKSAPHGSDGFTARTYHVPPRRYAPKANFYQEELPSVDIDTNPSPQRCQFMFSDGRQCTMARSEIHPSLCRYHSEREEQLFGDPVAGGRVVGAALDLPELYSACRDLSTPAGVHRAISQVFRLFAQRRISRQEASTFCHLGQLLLRTISLARSESDAASGDPVHSNTNNAVTLSESAVTDERRTSPKVVVVDEPQRERTAPLASSVCSRQISPLPSAVNEAAYLMSRASEVQSARCNGVEETSAGSAPLAHSKAAALAASASNSQAPQDQQLRATRQQLSQYQHLQNLET